MKFSKNTTIILGLSGGPDSVYLLHMLIKKKVNVVAAHINHGMRRSAKSDEKFCRKLCKKWGIPLEVRAINLKGISNSEEVGRKERYHFFAELKEKYGANYIATAHHLNDSIETTLLNLTRGTGLSGLTGITDRDDIIRPLKDMTKEEILKKLKELKLPYCTDPTNKKNTFSRNKIRNLVVPKLKEVNPRLEKTFARNMAYFGKVQNFLKSLATPHIVENKIEIKTFKTLHALLQNEILMEVHRSLTGSTEGLTMKQIENAKSVILKNKNLKGKLGKLRFETSYGTCTFGAKSKVVPTPSFKVEFVDGKSFKKSKNTVYISGDINPAELGVRNWQPGDRFRPLGMTRGSKKLQDFFTDRKIKKEDRHAIPILTHKKNIVAVGTLEVSENYKVEAGMKKILKISFK